MSKATKVVVPVVLLAVLAVGAAGIYTLLNRIGGGGGADYFTPIAEAAPSDTIAVIAIRDPASVLDYALSKLADEDRTQVMQEAGFDALDPAAYAEASIDFSAPAGVYVLQIDPPLVAVSIATTESGEAARESLVSFLTEKLEEDDDDLERGTVADHAAIWLDDEGVLVFTDDRLVVFAFDAPWDAEDARGDLEDAATAFLTADGESFAAQEGLSDALDFRGPTVAMGAGSIAAVKSLFEDVSPVGLGPLAGDDFDLVGMALFATGDSLSLQTRALVAEDSDYPRILAGAAPFGDAINQVPGPLELGFRLRVDPEAALAQLRTEMEAMPGAEEEFDSGLEQANAASGLDIEADVLANLTGEIGLFSQRLPSPDALEASRAVFFLGVKDTEKAAEVVAAISDAAEGMAQVRELDNGTAYVIPLGPRGAFAAYDGYIWVTADDQALINIMEGESSSFADDDQDAAGFFEREHHAGAYLRLDGTMGDIIVSDIDDPYGLRFFESMRFLTYETSLDGSVVTANLGLNLDAEEATTALMAAFGDGMFGRDEPGDVPPEVIPADPTPPVVPTQPDAGVVVQPPVPTNPPAMRGDLSAEARASLATISAGAQRYFSSPRFDAAGNTLPPSFPPSVGPTPSRSVLSVACASGSAMTLNPQQWTNASWRALGFTPPTIHRYIYEFAAHPGSKSGFTVTAIGDLDCDGTYSTFRQVGSVEGQRVTVGPIQETMPQE